MSVKRKLLKISVVISTLGLTLFLSVYCAIFIFRLLPFSPNFRLQANNTTSNSNIFVNHLIGTNTRRYPWLLPAAVIFAIARKIMPPVDNLLRRFNRSNNSFTANVTLPEFSPDLQNELSQMEVGNDGRFTQPLSFGLFNFFSAFFFLLLVFVCFLIISSFLSQQNFSTIY